MKLKTKYIVCFINEENVKTTIGIESYATTMLFEPCQYMLKDIEFDTKLEAIEYIQEMGHEEYNYTIIEVIKPYKGKE